MPKKKPKKGLDRYLVKSPKTLTEAARKPDEKLSINQASSASMSEERKAVNVIKEKMLLQEISTKVKKFSSLPDLKSLGKEKSVRKTVFLSQERGTSISRSLSLNDLTPLEKGKSTEGLKLDGVSLKEQESLESRMVKSISGVESETLAIKKESFLEGAAVAAERSSFLEGGATAMIESEEIAKRVLFEGNFLSKKYLESQFDKKQLQNFKTNKKKMTFPSMKEKKRDLKDLGEVIRKINRRFREVETLPGHAIYRTMDIEDAKALEKFNANIQEKQARINQIFTEVKDAKTINQLIEKEELLIPVSGHLGDLEQAGEYFERGKNVALVKFNLKPGSAHEKLLFDNEVLSLQDKDKTALVKKVVETKVEMQTSYYKANPNEGTLAGYIGLKAEHGDYLSMGIGDAKNSKLLFSTFVKDIEVLQIKGG